MLLLDVINEELGQVPEMTIELKEKIRLQEWDEKRVQLAINIVEQLESLFLKCKSIFEDTFICPYLRFKPLSLNLTEDEVKEFSKELTSEKIDKKLSAVLKGMNLLSPNIHFEYGGCVYDRGTYHFKVYWKI